MSASDTTTEHPDAEQLPLPPTDDAGLQAFLDELNELEDVHAGYPRDAAAQCGASGCAIAIYLVAIIIVGFGQRVLCPLHALALIDREVSRE